MAWHCNQPMSFPAMRGEEDGELTKLCLRDTMHAYYLRTKAARRRSGANQFLLCYGSKFLGQPVSKQRISKWLQELVRDCYKREGLEPPGGVKGHQVRKQATSWADLAGVDPATICQAATWRTSKGISTMFGKYYKLDLLRSNTSDLGRRVFEVSASTSAESAIRRNLGSAAAPASAPTSRTAHRRRQKSKDKS